MKAKQPVRRPRTEANAVAMLMAQKFGVSVKAIKLLGIQRLLAMSDEARTMMIGVAQRTKRLEAAESREASTLCSRMIVERAKAVLRGAGIA